MGTRRLVLAGIVGALVAWWWSRDEGQRVYLRSVGRQVPHLPGRYRV